jgi:biotin synthase
MKLSLSDINCLQTYLKEAGRKEFAAIIQYFYEQSSREERRILSGYACRMRDLYYGSRVYFRGLIEFSSYCKNECYYCGLQRSNRLAVRYRLTDQEILDCCEKGYALGFRTFVLQSGEDAFFTDEMLCTMVSQIKKRFSDCAVTLSIGERSFTSYQRLFEAGTDRYLLRHETANEDHYKKLHPLELSLRNRKECLYHLKKIGYQVGAGFMVDSPYQTYETLAEDFIFLRELSPHMIGIGPFIPHKDTKFAEYCHPVVDHTLILLSLLRIMLPKTLFPATTALGTVDSTGREKGLLAGANVVMPNLSPVLHRKDYSIYDNKICTGEEASEYVGCLCARISSIGLTPDFSRGDYADLQKGGKFDENGT